MSQLRWASLALVQQFITLFSVAPCAVSRARVFPLATSGCCLAAVRVAAKPPTAGGAARPARPGGHGRPRAVPISLCHDATRDVVASRAGRAWPPTRRRWDTRCDRRDLSSAFREKCCFLQHSAQINRHAAFSYSRRFPQPGSAVSISGVITQVLYDRNLCGNPKGLPPYTRSWFLHAARHARPPRRGGREVRGVGPVCACARGAIRCDACTPGQACCRRLPNSHRAADALERPARARRGQREVHASARRACALRGRARRRRGAACLEPAGARAPRAPAARRRAVKDAAPRVFALGVRVRAAARR